MHRTILAVLFLAGQSLSAAMAQTPPPSGDNGGIGAEKPTKQEVRKDEAAILPNAEGHQSSAAPTMVRDCTKNPADCTEPLTRGDRSTAQGVQSK